MHLQIQKIKNNFLKTSNFIGLSGVLLICSSLGDFQNVENYIVKSPIKNSNPSVITIRQFDRYNTNIPKNAILHSQILQSYPYFKIFFCILGIISSSIALKLALEEQENSDINEYAKIISKDKIKADIDIDRALYDKKQKMLVDVQLLNLHEELLENPQYKQLMLDKYKVENGIVEDEEQDNEDNTDLFVSDDFNSDSDSWFTIEEIKIIKKLIRQKLSIKEILNRVKPEYNSVHHNWNDIKQELILKLKGTEDNENETAE